MKKTTKKTKQLIALLTLLAVVAAPLAGPLGPSMSSMAAQTMEDDSPQSFNEGPPESSDNTEGIAAQGRNDNPLGDGGTEQTTPRGRNDNEEGDPGQEPITLQGFSIESPADDDNSPDIVPLADTRYWNSATAPDLKDTGDDIGIHIQTGAGGTLEIPNNKTVTIIASADAGHATELATSQKIMIGINSTVIWTGHAAYTLPRGSGILTATPVAIVLSGIEDQESLFILKGSITVDSKEDQENIYWQTSAIAATNVEIEIDGGHLEVIGPEANPGSGDNVYAALDIQGGSVLLKNDASIDSATRAIKADNGDITLKQAKVSSGPDVAMESIGGGDIHVEDSMVTNVGDYRRNDDRGDAIYAHTKDASEEPGNITVINSTIFSEKASAIHFNAVGASGSKNKLSISAGSKIKTESETAYLVGEYAIDWKGEASSDFSLEDSSVEGETGAALRFESTDGKIEIVNSTITSPNFAASFPGTGLDVVVKDNSQLQARYCLSVDSGTSSTGTPNTITVQDSTLTVTAEGASEYISGIQISGAVANILNIKEGTVIEVDEPDTAASTAVYATPITSGTNGAHIINMSGGEISVSGLAAGIFAPVSGTAVNMSGGKISTEGGAFGITTIDLMAAMANNLTEVYLNDTAVTVNGDAVIAASGYNSIVGTNLPNGAAIASVGPVNVSGTAKLMADEGPAIAATGNIAMQDNALAFAYADVVLGGQKVINAYNPMGGTVPTSTITQNAMAIAWDAEKYDPDGGFYVLDTAKDISFRATPASGQETFAQWARKEGEADAPPQSGIHYYSAPENAEPNAANDGFIHLDVTLRMSRPMGEITLEGQNSPASAPEYRFGQVPLSGDETDPGFTLALQDVATVTISGLDGQDQELESIRYLQSDSFLELYELSADLEAKQAEGKDWPLYTTPIELTAPSGGVHSGYIYALLTDADDQVSFIGTDGIVIYHAATADPQDFTFYQNMGEDVEAHIEPGDGNADFALAWVDESQSTTTPLTLDEDYTWDATTGSLTILSAYLDSLSAGDHVFALSYQWTGPGQTYEAGDAPVLTLNVEVQEAIFVDDEKVENPTVSGIQTAINQALDTSNSDTVTVTGKHGGADSELEIYIPEDKTLLWNADYPAAYYTGNYVISVSGHQNPDRGSGEMEIGARGSITSNVVRVMVLNDSVTLSVLKDADADTAIFVSGNTAVALMDDSELNLIRGTINGQVTASDNATVRILGGVVHLGNTLASGGGRSIVMSGTSALMLAGGSVTNITNTNAVRLVGNYEGSKPFVYVKDIGSGIADDSISVDTQGGATEAVAVYKTAEDAAKFDSNFPSVNRFQLDTYKLTTIGDTVYNYAGGTENAHAGTVTAAFVKELNIEDMTAIVADDDDLIAGEEYVARGNQVTFMGVYDTGEEKLHLEISGTLSDGRIPVDFETEAFGVNINTPITAVTVTAPGNFVYGATLDESQISATAVEEGVVDPQYSYEYRGTLDDENKTAYPLNAKAPTEPGTYTVVATLTSSSHRGSGESGPFRITPGPLSWSEDGRVSDKAYDSETIATVTHSPTLLGVINRDDENGGVSVVEGEAHFASAEVGTWPVTGTGWGVAGVNAWKYNEPAEQPVFRPARITGPEVTAISAISISPAYQTVQAGKGLDLLAITLPEDEALAMGAVDWFYDEGAFERIMPTPGSGGRPAPGELRLRVLLPGDIPGKAGAVPGTSYRIVAQLESADGHTYESYAEVYVHAGEITDSSASLKAFEITPLETAVRINRAQTAGALLPIKVADKTSDTLSVTYVTNALLEKIFVDHGVGLYTGYGTAKEQRLDPETIRIDLSTRDPRALELFAKEGAKSVKNVSVVVAPGTSAAWDIGRINITVVESYPKIRISANSSLNRFYPEAEMSFTATASDGIEVRITKIEPTGANANMVMAGSDADSLKLNMANAQKNKTVGVDLTLDLVGYERAFKVNKNNAGGTLFRSSVRIVDTEPKLRLSPSTVLAELSELPGKDLPFFVNLQGVEPKDVVEIRFEEETVPLSALEGNQLELRATKADSKARVELRMAGSGERWIGANLRVNAANMEKATKLRTPTKSVSIHQAYQAGEIVQIEVVPQVATVFFADSPDSDLDVEIPEAIRDLVKATVKDNTVILEKIGEDNLKPGTYDIKMTPSRDIPRFAKISPLTYKLRVTNATTASVTLSQKGRLNVAVADSAVAVTVRPNGTASKIKNVTLGGVHEDLFEATPTGDFTFEIKAMPAARDAKNADHGKRIIPGVRYTLGGLEIEMENGEKMSPARALVITPTTTVARGNRSPASLTLYTSTPAVGEALNLSLSGTGVTLGEARLEQKRLDSFKFKDSLEGKEAVDGFELVRSGRDAWLVGFEGGRVPVVLNKQQTAEMALKKSYTLRVEVWADGTYVLEDEKPVALRDDSGRARTKPRMLNVRVNVR